MNQCAEFLVTDLNAAQAGDELPVGGSQGWRVTQGSNAWKCDQLNCCDAVTTIASSGNSWAESNSLGNHDNVARRFRHHASAFHCALQQSVDVNPIQAYVPDPIKTKTSSLFSGMFILVSCRALSVA
ncbi:MAG: hypothetical protein ACFCUJ_07235 [Thiotrichales bacterium]